MKNRDDTQLSTVNSQLKNRYKQTEVGVIPEDWEVKPLNTLASKIMVGIASAATHAYRDRGIVLFRNQNIKSGYLDDSDVLYITPEYEAAFKNKRLMSGDLLTARTGYPGTTCIVPAWYESSQSFTTLITRPKISAVDSEYLCCYINSEQGQAFFEQNQIGGGQKNVNAGSLKQLPVPLPPSKAEQRAIATALSDVDALLAAQDKLIAKKRDIKQATMQQLLTGKQRLRKTGENGEWIVDRAGNPVFFSGEWEVKRLGDVFTISAGKSKSAFVTAGGRYWIVDMGSVSTDGKLVVSKSTNFHGDFLKLGELVMPKDDIGGGGIIGKVGYIDADETYVLGDHVYRMSAKVGSPLFLSYLINGHRTNTELRKKVIGSAQLGLGRKSVEEQEILFPSNEEQTAIATVLSDMDTELAALAQQRDKTRALKHAMMQELLTGKIRLIPKADNHG